MTDITSGTDIHTSDEARARLAARYRKEARFKFLGLGAVLVAALFLVLLLINIVSKAYHAFSYTYVSLPIELSLKDVDPSGGEDKKALSGYNYMGVLRAGLEEQLPFVSGRRDKRVRNGLITGAAGVRFAEEVKANPQMLTGKMNLDVQLDDEGDLYFKGLVTSRSTLDVNGIATPSGTEGDVTVLSGADDFAELIEAAKVGLARQAAAARLQEAAQGRSVERVQSQIEDMKVRIADAEGDEKTRLESALASLEEGLAVRQTAVERHKQEAEALEARVNQPAEFEAISETLPSFLLHINEGVVKVTEASQSGVKGQVLVPLASSDAAQVGDWRVERLEKPESSRKVSDKQIAWLDKLDEAGLIKTKFNSTLFTKGASREPEQAGILGAIVGSFFTMVVTLLLSFPLGVAAAIYLEEFAPKNRFTQLIEVNINNLAAVPSIVFGLLGLAMFLNVFGLPRSAPVVGGMVLALMTLPTIIIASRAALRAVPPSIREAALGIGASRIQTVFHHVLPLAMPGILTGTIIGMAQALGETAPLLMIGMVAFIADIPGGPLDAATVLPVQIYMWADFPEVAFQQKTSAAILILLAFLVAMNLLAVILRKRFERRW